MGTKVLTLQCPLPFLTAKIRHNNLIIKFWETQICEKYLFEWLQPPALSSHNNNGVHSYSQELGRMGLEPVGRRDRSLFVLQFLSNHTIWQVYQLEHAVIVLPKKRLKKNIKFLEAIQMSHKFTQTTYETDRPSLNLVCRVDLLVINESVKMHVCALDLCYYTT